MSYTYSINLDSSVESTRKVDIFSVLQSIPNNTQKLIRPRDIRDAFLSTWSNSPFKITKISGSDKEYIGLDSGDPNNRDIKNKIFIGKRNFGGNDVMTESTLSSDTDIFLYNTKPDLDIDQSTKISILSGTDSSNFINSPFIKVSNTGSIYDMSIENPSGGDINITSSTGRVFINGLALPTVEENSASLNNSFILTYTGEYPFGRAEWRDPAEFSPTLTSIGNTGSETNIYGSPINVNGFSLEFVDDRFVPEDIGGIEQGFSFSTNSFNGQDWPLSEVIRKIVYPYVPPKLEIESTNILTNNKFGDIGDDNTFSVSYSITTFAREDSELLFDIKILRDLTEILDIGTFSSTPGSITSSVFLDTSSPTYSGSQSIYELITTSIINGQTTSNSTTYSVSLIKPFISMIIDDLDPNFITDNDVVDGTGNATQSIGSYLSDSTSKNIIPLSDVVTIDNTSFTNTQGHLYFAHPFEYGIFSGIRYNNQFILQTIDFFTHSESPVTIPGVYDSYRVYKSLDPIIYDPSDVFDLIFNTVFVPVPIQSINDDWLYDSLLPISTGQITGIGTVPPFPPNTAASSSTYSISFAYISNNGNDYQSDFNNIDTGSIFSIEYSSYRIVYVVISRTLDPQTITVNASALIGSSISNISPTNGNTIKLEIIKF